MLSHATAATGTTYLQGTATSGGLILRVAQQKKQQPAPYDRKLTDAEEKIVQDVLKQHPKLSLKEAIKALIDTGM